ncbi:MAG: inorganic diphosphatase [Gammaproteobacteria bacterium]|nr:inorganic diphosphatase [Gammaproteobacteria bacterium]MAV66640.1 inorganic diphosphatase [Gammaproteobacteria bacterium]
MKPILTLFTIMLGTSNAAADRYDDIKIQYKSEYRLSSGLNYLKGIEPINSDGTVNVVVEIPAGTNEKWEVSKKTGDIEWEFKKGKPRIVEYLSYPTSYGMIPKTLLSKDLGGDGDPLDVILLGAYIERGKIVKGKIIGTLRMLDGGEIDDKLLMIQNGSPLYKVNNLEELKEQFPGSLSIIKIWFESYKGLGKIKIDGYGSVSDAMKILDKSILEFKRQRI